MYLESSSNEYSFGDIFLVHLKVDTEKERINAGKIEILFPAEKLEVIDILKENSIFTLWPQEPEVSEKGKISFVGGVPLGFEGKGKILSIAFKVISNSVSKGEIKFSKDCLLLLNDGLGTESKLKTKNFFLSLLPTHSKKPKNELKELLEKDNIPPEPFQIYLGKSDFVFNGRYFISFFAVDFQSGIDHYEIQEGKGPWKKTKFNFYLLNDQNLKSEIKVKAVDKAGNERISVLKLF